jgi:hypothetical protein
MAKFNRNNLGQGNASAKDVTPPKAQFLAEPLTITATTPDGKVIMQTVVDPRGFTPKLDKRSNTWSATVGWYGDVRGEDCGEYAGYPVSAGLRFSIAGIKVAPGDEVDLLSDDDDHGAEG